jgi:hypothetical protein
MAPRSSTDYSIYNTLRDANRPRYVNLTFSSSMPMTNRNNERVRESRARMILALGCTGQCASITTFRDHVLRILLLRAEEKMVGVHAPAVVALVQDAHIHGQLPAKKEPRGAVRKELRVAKAERSVTVLHDVARPVPARTVTVTDHELALEPLDGWLSNSSSHSPIVPSAFYNATLRPPVFEVGHDAHCTEVF